jgi:hypothetical protein
MISFRESWQVLTCRCHPEVERPPACRSKAAGRGAVKASKMKAPRMDPGLSELLGLSLVACGAASLAFVQGDLLFVAIFGAACGVIAIEALRRLP